MSVPRIFSSQLDSPSISQGNAFGVAILLHGSGPLRSFPTVPVNRFLQQRCGTNVHIDLSVMGAGGAKSTGFLVADKAHLPAVCIGGVTSYADWLAQTRCDVQAFHSDVPRAEIFVAVVGDFVASGRDHPESLNAEINHQRAFCRDLERTLAIVVYPYFIIAEQTADELYWWSTAPTATDSDLAYAKTFESIADAIQDQMSLTRRCNHG